MLTISTFGKYWLLKCLIIITRPKLEIFKTPKYYLAWESVFIIITVFSLNTDLHIIHTDLNTNTKTLLWFWPYETVMINETWFRPTSMPKLFSGSCLVRREYFSVYAMLGLAWKHSRLIKLKLSITERLFADKLNLQVSTSWTKYCFSVLQSSLFLISLPLPL